MAKKTDRNDPKDKGISKVGGTDLGWLAEIEGDQSLAQLQQHVIVPRLKIVQGSSDPALKEQFSEGTVLMNPGATLVAEPGDFFSFVPLHFHTEYAKWADRNDKDNPMIMERSYDPTSELAKKCEDPDQRSEIYPGDEKIKDPKKQRFFRYVKSFHFVGVIFGEHPLAGTETTISFSKGEHGQGRNFITACSLRRQEVASEGGSAARRLQVPLWGQIWMFKTSIRTKGTNSWHGYDFLAGEPAVVTREDAPALQARSMELAEAFEQRRLVIDGAESESEGDEPSSDGRF